MPGEWLYFLLALTNYWWRNLCDTNQKWRAFAFKASCALLLQPTPFKKCNVYFERKSSSFTFSLKSSQIHFDLATSLQVFGNWLGSYMQTTGDQSILLLTDAVSNAALHTSLTPI